MPIQGYCKKQPSQFARVFYHGPFRKGNRFHQKGKLIFASIAFIATVFLLFPQAYGGTLYEYFYNNKFNSDYFFTYAQGGPTVTVANNRLEITIPESASGRLDGFLENNFLLKGDFDVQVDFNLLIWPAANGVGMGIFGNNCELSRRSFGEEVYELYIAGTEFRINTADTQGKLRLIRKGNTLKGFFWGDGWQSIGSSTNSQLGGEMYLSIGAFSPAGQFMGKEVKVAFDNLLETTKVEVANKIYGLFIGADQDITDQPCVRNSFGKGATILSNKFCNLPNYTESILLTNKMADGGNKKSDVQAAINSIKNKLKSGDGLVFFVNSHGGLIGSECSPTGYALAIGSELPTRIFGVDIVSLFPNDFLTDKDLHNMLDGMDNIQKWVFIDACYSGGFYESIHTLTNACLIASTTADKVAYGNDDGLSGEVMGLFATALDTGLSRKDNGELFLDVDPENPGIVTFIEIVNYIEDYSQKTDWVGSIVYELDFGDTTIFTLDKWTPTGVTTIDFVGGLGKRKVNMAPILHLLFDPMGCAVPSE